jgi:tetratricopeptide (TPR) repeat protein
MTEFRDWRFSEPKEGAKDRILWIRGPLGIGKSTMSAYFIDLLKLMYPNSIVAYFFCRSNQAGLTKAHEIIRTLAYQCIDGNRAARSVLQELKEKDFQICDSLGIGYLFEKILLEPLQCTQKEIYIIIDGLDEANTTDCHNSDHSPEPDLHVLLASLAKLPATRLLFVSRPSSNISSVIPCTKTKAIGKSENAKDIATYVKNALNESERLRKHFQNENLSPFQYFQEKANGVFLWVELVIKQLGKANSKSVFRKYLDGFSAASGSIERLYESILLKFGEEDQPWVKETLRWLVVAEEQMKVLELADAVEWCLQDQHIDFRRFLEVECGSILQLMPAWNNEVIVQLVHETFRSFLLNERTCPKSFFVDETEVHAHVTSKCLSRMSSNGTVDRYCLSNWIDHLLKATSKAKAPEVLVSLYQFFTSDALERWIKEYLTLILVTVEDQHLIVISSWLEKRRISGVGDNVDHSSDNAKAMSESLQWLDEMTKVRSSLGEYIGKAAARIWLRESFDAEKSLRGYFSIALRHYWNRITRNTEHVSNLSDLQELLDTDFRTLAEWCGDSGRTVNKSSKGVAFYYLQRWDDCIRCFGVLEVGEGVAPETVAPYLALALFAKGNNEEAIAVLRKLDNLGFSELSLLRRAYERKGDLDAAIQVMAANFDTAFEGYDAPSFRDLRARSLLELYMKKGDLDGAVSFFERRMTESPSRDSVYDLALAHLVKGDADEAITILTMPDTDSRWVYLILRACKMKGEYNGAIRSLTAAVKREAKSAILWRSLMWVHEMERDFHQAIQVMECAAENLPTGALAKFIGSLYIAKDDVSPKYGESIELLEMAAARHPGECIFWQRIGLASSQMKDFGRAITAFTAALEVVGWKEDSLMQSLFEAYKDKGDYDGAIRVFKSNIAPAIMSSDDYDVRYWCTAVVDIYGAQGDLDGAIEFFESILSQSQCGKGDWAMLGLLKAYLGKADYEAAISKYDEAISRSQITVSTLFETMILEAYLAKGDYQGAIKRFTQVAESRPFDSATWIVLGRAYQAKGDYSSAIQVCQSARQLLSLDYVFLLEIGDSHLLNGEYQCAVDAYKSFFEMAVDPIILYAYVKRANPLETLLSVLSRKPLLDESFSKSFLWYSLGRAYQCNGNSDAAYEIYSQAISGYLATIERAPGTEVNRLLWIHTGVNTRRNGIIDSGYQSHLSMAFVWSALGEVYRATGDLNSALKAFREAQNFEQRNPWLQETLRELEIATAV